MVSLFPSHVLIVLRRICIILLFPTLYVAVTLCTYVNESALFGRGDDISKFISRYEIY